eukprot:gene11792-biopygen1859
MMFPCGFRKLGIANEHDTWCIAVIPASGTAMLALHCSGEWRGTTIIVPAPYTYGVIWFPKEREAVSKNVSNAKFSCLLSILLRSSSVRLRAEKLVYTIRDRTIRENEVHYARRQLLFALFGVTQGRVFYNLGPLRRLSSRCIPSPSPPAIGGCPNWSAAA